MAGAEPHLFPVSERTRAIESALRWTCVATAFLALLPGLRLLGLIWDNTDYLAHGYMIPPVSALLAYSRRKAIVRAVRSGPVPATGPLWVLLAALIETAAVAGEVVTVAGAGVPLLLAATAYAVGGRPLLRAAGLPIAFLILMVPIPTLIENRILIDLKAVVVQLSVDLLQRLGYTVMATGNRIFVPGHELFVADACSGLTSIATLLPLSVVVAYFVGHGVWRRVAIVASIVPFAMLGNLARVSITTALVASGSIEYSEGLLHESMGLATFVLGTLALVTFAKLLR
jgi:exosortase